MRAKPQKTKFQEVIYYASIKLFAMTCVYNQNELCSKGDIRVGGSGAKAPWKRAARASRSAVRARCPTPPAAAVRNRCRLQGAELYLLTTTVNAKPEISISPETAHAAARKPSAALSAVAAGNKYEKIRKSVLTTGWESAILQ